MVQRNATIARLGEWAANPQLMEQFTQVVLLTQRTSAVKQIMCLDEPDWLVIQHIKRICEKHGIDCNLKRGVGYSNLHAKTLTATKRLHGSTLMCLFLAHPETGLALEGEGIVSGRMLDRILDVYMLYLRVTRSSAEAAEVSFELFYFMVQSYLTGDLDMSSCDCCGGGFVNLKVSQSVHCPVCGRLNLAKYSPRVAPLQSVVARGSALDRREVAVARMH